MSDNCPQDYKGVERRVRIEDRRAKCIYHEAHEEKFVDLKAHQTGFNRVIEKMLVSIDTKVPMKLFYVVVGLVMTILAFQWTTYERVNQIALTHIEAMGSIDTKITEIQSDIEHTNEVSAMEKEQIKFSLEANQNSTRANISKIETVVEDIQNKQNRILNKIEKFHDGGS